MTRAIEAIYERGVFRPLGAVPEVSEGSRVLLTVRKPVDKAALRKLAGSVSAEDAERMQQAITEGRRVEDRR